MRLIWLYFQVYYLYEITWSYISANLRSKAITRYKRHPQICPSNSQARASAKSPQQILSMSKAQSSNANMVFSTEKEVESSTQIDPNPQPVTQVYMICANQPVSQDQIKKVPTVENLENRSPFFLTVTVILYLDPLPLGSIMMNLIPPCIQRL